MNQMIKRSFDFEPDLWHVNNHFAGRRLNGHHGCQSHDRHLQVVSCRFQVLIVSHFLHGIIPRSRDVAKALARRFDESEVESFVVVMLNAQNRAISYQEVTRGILNSSLVHPREVFRLSILYGAAGIIVAHNHPSGNPAPSADDKAITKQLVEAGALLDNGLHERSSISDRVRRNS